MNNPHNSFTYFQQLRLSFCDLERIEMGEGHKYSLEGVTKSDGEPFLGKTVWSGTANYKTDGFHWYPNVELDIFEFIVNELGSVLPVTIHGEQRSEIAYIYVADIPSNIVNCDLKNMLDSLLRRAVLNVNNKYEREFIKSPSY